MNNLQHITAWLTDLVDLCVITRPMPDQISRLMASASLLAEDFPPEAFCRESIKAVARQCKFFPAYGEVADHLTVWWKENRPSAMLISMGSSHWAGLPSPAPRSAPEPAELEAVSNIVKMFKAERAAVSVASPAPKTVAKPLPVSDGLLLREYEKLADQGDSCAATRAVVLRRKLRT